jgi:hypothetical protein
MRFGWIQVQALCWLPMKRLPVILLATLFTVTAAATTYVRVEKDGTKTYSDRPIPGGKPVELEPAQTYSSQQPTISTPRSNAPIEQQLLDQLSDFRYESCTVSPANDTTYVNPEKVTVGVQISPELQPTHTLVLTVDGQPVPGGPNVRNATLTEVYRGTHTVAVTVTNGYGQTMCSASASFHVQRPSLNSPARR